MENREEIKPENLQTSEGPAPLVGKIIFVAVLIIFLALVYSMQDADDVSLSQIDNALQEQTDISDMQKCTDRQLMQFIGLDASSYDSYIYYKSKAALGADELLIVKAKNKSDLDGVQDAVETRIDNQIKTFEGYGPEQVAMLKNAVIEKRGNYLFYCTADNPQEYEEVFKNAI